MHYFLFCIFVLSALISLVFTVYLINALVFRRRLTRFFNYLLNGDTEIFIEKTQNLMSLCKLSFSRNAAMIQLSLGYEALGEYQKALFLLKIAGSRNVFINKGFYYISLCRMYLNTDNFEKARAVYSQNERYIKNAPPHFSYTVLGELMASENDIQGKALLEKALQEALPFEKRRIEYFLEKYR